MVQSDTLEAAEEFLKAQGFHIMTEDDISGFVDCATESYGSISYPLDDYFVGHSCTREEVREMWLFNLRTSTKGPSSIRTAPSAMPGFYGYLLDAKAFL